MTSRPQFDQADQTGKTLQFTGTVGTTAIKLPTSPVADHVVAEVLVNTQRISSTAKKLLVSYDGGTTFMEIKRNTLVGWFIRAEGRSQIDIKGNVAGVEYDIVVNLEEC